VYLVDRDGRRDASYRLALLEKWGGTMSRTTVDALALFLAVVAAARSTWSPCGISMLSMLTPLGERSRGHRYPVTVAWFVAGAVLGGATLGGFAAGLAVAVRGWSPSGHTTALVVVAAAVVTIGSDLTIGGLSLPRIPRQVNEVWTGRYRGWTYASAFGWQIGVGVSTYVMTAAVYLAVVTAALTGSPLAALAVGTCFGLVRGLAVLAGARLTSPAAIRSFHRRFDAASPWSLRVAVAAQGGALALGAAELSGSALLVVAIVACSASAIVVAQRAWHPARRDFSQLS
jgi:MFS family permease